MLVLLADGEVKSVTTSGTVRYSILLVLIRLLTTAEDSAGNTSTATRTITVVDTTAPVITLLGDNPAEVELGSSYTDAGATADGGETDHSGTVDTQYCWYLYDHLLSYDASR